MRKTVLTAIGALALMTSSQAMAAHTAAELNQYFGEDPMSVPKYDVNPGDMVLLPTWLRLLTGDNPNLGLHIFSYEVYADNCSLVAWGGNTAGTLPGGSVTVMPGAGSCQPHMNNPFPDGGSLFLVQTSHNGSSTDPLLAGEGAIQLGELKLNVSPAAQPGQQIRLYFAVGAGQYGTTSSLTSHNTMAYGAGSDGVGGLNTYRRQNTTLDVIATGVGHVSTQPDAIINIVPEPMSLGLVGLGLLAIRRRRAA